MFETTYPEEKFTCVDALVAGAKKKVSFWEHKNDIMKNWTGTKQLNTFWANKYLSTKKKKDKLNLKNKSTRLNDRLGHFKWTIIGSEKERKILIAQIQGRRLGWSFFVRNNRPGKIREIQKKVGVLINDQSHTETRIEIPCESRLFVYFIHYPL